MARPGSTKILRRVESARSATSSSTRRKAFPTRWLVHEAAAPEAIAALRGALNVSAPFAQILSRRGLAEPASAEAFLLAKLDALHDPAALPDMAAAVARIEEAVARKQRVALFGDYDVDGVSATALMAGFFRVLRFPVEALVPERDQGGYGLSPQAVERLLALKPDLVITLDNGIAAHAALSQLRDAGVDAIVVDHHHVGEALPPALAVINPKRADSTYPYDELCGAGLAFKLAWASAQAFSHNAKVTPEFRAFLKDALALAALGTLADVVPLTGENRILAAHGLKTLARPAAPGLGALLDVCQIDGALNAYDVGFRLAPRINAAGRCGQAADALELLLTQDVARARELAAKLDALNRERQAIETRIWTQARTEALARLAAEPAPRALVLDAPDWHPGVIGIVASRIVEEFHRPAVLLSHESETGAARGSGRSIRGFHLAEAFEACAEWLPSHGGHAMAAGLTVKLADLPAFRVALEREASDRLRDEDLQPQVQAELALPLKDVTEAFCAELRRLEPCGAGNPRALIAALGVGVAGRPKPLGQEERHVTFFAKQDETVLRAVGFGMGERFNQLCAQAESGALDLVFRPELNTFRGTTSVELHVQAFRPAKAGSPTS